MPIVIPPGTALAGIKVEDEVTYNIGGVVYAGKIRHIEPDDLRPYGIGLDIDCQDFTSLLVDEICVGVRTAVETDAQRISWLLSMFDRRGLSAYHVQTLYASMPAQDFTGMTLFDAIKSVLAFSNGQFYVDRAKDLHTFTSEVSAAPFALSDAPDNVTSFPFADFKYPKDSIDLRNAVLGIPTRTVPTLADSVSATLTISGGLLNTRASAVLMLSLRPAGSMPIARIGDPGPFTTKVLVGTPDTIALPFSQPTRAGSFLLAWIATLAFSPISMADGWTELMRFRSIQGHYVSFWAKPVSVVSELPPVFTTTGSVNFPTYGQVAEFVNVATINPVEFAMSSAPIVTAGATAVTMTPIAQGIDAALGNLVIMASTVSSGSLVTAVVSEAFNNSGATVHIGDSGGQSQQAHAAFAYTILPQLAVPTWYRDEASIATYGQRDDSFESSDATTQAALDALGAAYIAKNANPRREASCMVDQFGLAAGQIVNITNTLYGLAAEPFRVQSVETTYSENVPRFEVQFSDPRTTLAAQVMSLQGEVSSSSGAVAPSPQIARLLAYSETVVTQGGITAETSLDSLSVTANVGTGRRIRITVYLTVVSTVVGDIFEARIKEGATQLQTSQSTRTSGSGNNTHAMSVVLNPTAGLHTYNVTGLLASGSGVYTVQGSTTTPCYISVEDIGT